MSDKSKCTTHTIQEKVLKESIFTAIMLQLKLATNITELLEELEKEEANKSKVTLYEKTVQNLLKNKQLKEKILNELYFDLKSELITVNQYKELRESTEKDLQQIERELVKLENQNVDNENKNDLTLVSVFEKIDNKNELTREMITELIDCIYINDDKSIKIDFKFADEIEMALELVK